MSAMTDELLEVQREADEWFVKQAAEWLDEVAPAGWEARVNTLTLNIDDAETCVVGQVFRDEAGAAGIANGYCYVLRNWGIKHVAFYDGREGIHAAWVRLLDERTGRVA